MGGVASSANALLSKLEPIEVIDHPLPGRIAGRGVLMAHFGDGDDGLTIAIAHLALGANSRRSQIAFIAELLHERRHAVLMGDFNCLPDRPDMELLYKRTRLQPPAFCVPTFPSWRPQKAIDHILVTGSLAQESMHALPAALSDHLALSIQLDVPEQALRQA
jgi:endonuclease/exonuclease/phosphatase family metal-dependent hydrolase